jgi:hypothetical protein
MTLGEKAGSLRRTCGFERAQGPAGRISVGNFKPNRSQIPDFSFSMYQAISTK